MVSVSRGLAFKTSANKKDSIVSVTGLHILSASNSSYKSTFYFLYLFSKTFGNWKDQRYRLFLMILTYYFFNYTKMGWLITVYIKLLEKWFDNQWSHFGFIEDILSLSQQRLPVLVGLTAKGQLISKCLFEVFVWTKIPTKILIGSALALSGQKLSNFLLVFWSKRSLQKDILKLTDL